MRVVIPVAGAGTRLKPHTHSQPKALLHVAGKPIISHLLDPIVKLDPEEVIFIIGFRGDMIEDFVRRNFSFKSTFVTQEKLHGLGYALNLAIRDINDGDLLVLLGDTIVECDLHKFIKAGENVLGLRQVDDPRRFGVAVVENDRVVQLEEKPEKPRSNLAIIGLYYFNDIAPLKRALGGHVESGKTTRGEIQFTDALQGMIEQGASFSPYEVQEWFDCGKKETMLSTNKHLVASINQSPKLQNSAVIPPVYVHPNATVANSVLGPNVSISEGSAVRDSIIRNSIIGCNTTVDNMILEDSLLGNEVRLRGNSQVLNLGESSEVNPA
ncbi:MAG: nucleotidyl transferase [Candidatus Zixiibacteriota bacterium]|nr:MAG: nucleotidyl transferase [candidate division Zixibacteria bacterium]